MMAGLFRRKEQTPEVEKPERMPDPFDPSIIAAERQARQDALKRRGRLSTIMTDNLSKIAGGTRKLG